MLAKQLVKLVQKTTKKDEIQKGNPYTIFHYTIAGFISFAVGYRGGLSGIGTTTSAHNAKV